MDFKLINNHIVLSLETNVGMKTVVFDTGAGTTSFYDDAVKKFVFDGIEHTVSPFGAILATTLAQKRKQVEELVGCEADGFLCPNSFNTAFLIDFPNCSITLTDDYPHEEHEKIAINSLLGLPQFMMQINGEEMRTAFDTGNRYPFVRSHEVASLGLTPTDEMLEDYGPFFGEIQAKMYLGNIELGNALFLQTKIATSEQYDLAAGSVGVRAFLGIEPLKNSEVWISYEKSVMVVRTH